MNFFWCKKYEAQKVRKNTGTDTTLRKEFPTEVGPWYCFVKQWICLSGYFPLHDVLRPFSLDHFQVSDHTATPFSEPLILGKVYLCVV